MFNWLRKPQTSSLPVPKKSQGFFSTDFELKPKRSIAEILANLDHYAPKQLRPITPEGVTIGEDGKMITNIETGTGMDMDIQEAKFLNAGAAGVIPPLPQIDWYASQTFIGFQTCAIISQQWLVNKALLMPALDATRNGYELTVNDGSKVNPEILDYVRERDEYYDIDNKLVDQIYSGRLFGTRIAMYKVESADPDFYLKPFNPDSVKPGSYKGIVQIDPYWIMPILDTSSAIDPSSPRFYRATWWIINGKRVHHTHLCIMRNGGTVPDILKPTYYYGGIPLTQMIAERIYAAERTANEAPMLSLSKRMTVYKMDLTEAAPNLEALRDKVSQWSEIMNNFGIKVIGGDEEVNQFDLSLSDLDAVIMTQYQLVAACASVPATELLGTSPKGFNATGEFEAKSYTKFLKTLQKHYLNPLLRGHYLRLGHSEIKPKFGINPFFTINWLSTDSPTAKEQAEVNLIKAQTDNQLVQAGAIDGYDVRQRIIADPNSCYTGIENVVPGGPGDREAQMEAEGPLENPVNAKGTVRESSESDGEDSLTGQCAGVAYRQKDGMLLMVLRAPHKTNGDCWSFPAGHIEEGETAEECAVREFREETGHQLETSQLRKISNSFGFYLYLATGEAFAPKLDEEHTGYAWIKPGYEQQPLHPGLTDKILTELYAAPMRSGG